MFCVIPEFPLLSCVLKNKMLVDDQPLINQDGKSGVKQEECEHALIKEEPEELPTSEIRL